MFTAPETPQRPSATPTQPTAPGAPLRGIPAISTATAAAVSTASSAPCTPPRSSRPPLPALTAPPNQKTLNSLGKMRYRWNDPNLAARYRAADNRDIGASAGTADYAYPLLQMASEPARGGGAAEEEEGGVGLVGWDSAVSG